MGLQGVGSFREKKNTKKETSSNKVKCYSLGSLSLKHVLSFSSTEMLHPRSNSSLFNFFYL